MHLPIKGVLVALIGGRHSLGGWDVVERNNEYWIWMDGRDGGLCCESSESSRTSRGVVVAILMDGGRRGRCYRTVITVQDSTIPWYTFIFFFCIFYSSEYDRVIVKGNLGEPNHSHTSGDSPLPPDRNCLRLFQLLLALLSGNRWSTRRHFFSSRPLPELVEA